MSAGLPDFGRYITIRPIGVGAIGTVYQAHDPLIDRPVAVKMIRTELLDDTSRDAYRERFLTEAQAGGRFAHPAIVAIYDVGESGGRPYLVMEYVEGHTLEAALASTELRMTLDVPAVMSNLLAALGVAHAAGVIHRDIKPANIMIARTGGAKVMDFGIARLDHGNQTLIGDMIGTPSYMAPEQAIGDKVDHRADLFSAACVLHRILAGRPPFAGTTVSGTIMRLTGPGAADLTAVADGPFTYMVPVLRRGLAKDPALRFPTAAAFTDAFHTAWARGGDKTIIAPSPRSAVTVKQGVGMVNPALVARAAERLARHIGPIARVHAAKAAREATSATSFMTELARHIPQAENASQFLRDSGTTLSTMSDASIGSMPGLTPQIIEAARIALAAEAGPIARVLIGQALSTARTPQELIEHVVRAAPNPHAVQAWRRCLEAVVQKWTSGPQSLIVIGNQDLLDSNLS